MQRNIQDELNFSPMPAGARKGGPYRDQVSRSGATISRSLACDPSLQFIQRMQVPHVRVSVDLGPSLQKSLTSSENVQPRKASTRLLDSFFESAGMAAETH
jgi:hypothetical protein